MGERKSEEVFESWLIRGRILGFDDVSIGSERMPYELQREYINYRFCVGEGNDDFAKKAARRFLELSGGLRVEDFVEYFENAKREPYFV